MTQEEQTTEMTPEQKAKKSQVEAFIKEIEKHEADPNTVT